MASLKVVLNHKPKADGTFTIMLRITHNRKIKYRALGYSVKESDFNPQKEMVRKSNPKYKIINEVINSEKSKAEQIVGESVINHKPLSSEIIQNGLKTPSYGSFFDYCDRVLERREKSKSIIYNKVLRTTIKKLKEFRSQRDLSFDDINIVLLNDFVSHLFEKGNHQNTIYNDLKRIRTVIKEAIQEDIFPFERNPFFKFKLSQTITNKEKLTFEEIEKIEKLKLPIKSSLWHCKNYFLFSYYSAGIRSGDFIRLKWENIKDERIVYVMSKNNKSQDLKLAPQALKILELYKSSENKPKNYIFPLLDNAKDYSDKKYLFNQVSSKNAIINNNLKIIAKKAKISKNLSFHIARHSFADISRKKGGSVFDISQILNHGDIKTTERYLASFDNEAKDNLMDKMFNS